ncbi:MAG: endonuclease/exonuclease/phosphatase family protein [Chlamydiota bacterium]
MTSALKPSHGWDRTFLNLSSKMAEPFCAIWGLFRYRLVAPLDPKKFESCASKAEEIATRVFIGLGAIFGATLFAAMPAPLFFSVALLGAGSRLFRAIGFALQKGGYTHVRGEAPEKRLDGRDPQIKIMNWNVCGIAGGLSLDHGGVIAWRLRFNGIVQKIQAEDPDVLILEEIYDTALGEALIEKLKANYAHFFIHLGPSAMGSVGGCMVLSKCAVHSFSHESFANNHWTLNRGFATLEVKGNPQDLQPCARVIGTHLIHGSDPKDGISRMHQFAQIINSVAKKALPIPTVLTGDLNTERDKEEGAPLANRLIHGYTAQDPTCTNRMTAEWDGKSRAVWGEIIDYLSLFKEAVLDGKQLAVVSENIRIEDCHLVKAFDASYNTKTALSDHHGIMATIRGLRLPVLN